MSVEVGSLEDFDEGRIKILKIKGREIGVVVWGGIPYALRNTCPHQAGPVCAGVITRKLIAGPHVGEIDVKGDDPVLVCPWHGWEFDVRSGRLLSDGSLGIKTYPVHIDGDRVVVTLGREADGGPTAR